MTQPIIELAKADDAQCIGEMSRDHIETGLGWRYKKARILEMMEESETNVIVARHAADSAPVGFAAMQYKGFEAHLILFAVLPQWQRRRIGTALIRWHIKAAQVAGAQLIDVELVKRNRAARDFYAFLGFMEIGELPRYYDNTETATRMALDLRVRDAG